MMYNDEIFTDVLEPEQLKRILELESSYVGDLADLGDAAIPEIFENSFLAQNEDFMTDYQAALENAAQETLGKEFKTYTRWQTRTRHFRLDSRDTCVFVLAGPGEIATNRYYEREGSRPVSWTVRNTMRMIS